MSKKYDIVAVVGEYDGKKKYKNVGFVNENDKGYLSIKMDHLVTVDDEGKTVNWFSLFEPREKSSTASSGDDVDDDINF
jgi:hypothetical protein